MTWTVAPQQLPGWFAVYVGNENQTPKNYKDNYNYSSSFDNVQHYNNYLTRYCARQHRLAPASLPLRSATGTQLSKQMPHEHTVAD